MADALRDALQELVAIHDGKKPHAAITKDVDAWLARSQAAWSAARAALSAPLSQNAAPHIGQDEEGHLTFEWWHNDRKISIYPTDKLMLLSWAVPEDNRGTGKPWPLDFKEVNLPDAQAVYQAFGWLYADPISPDGFKLQSHPTERSGEVLARAKDER